MKLIIKNDSKETVKNPNVKIIETTEASFTNQIVFIEENDVPIIKYTDTEAMYFVKDLDNLYDRKSKSEVLLNITIDNLELIGGGSGGDFVPLTGTEPGSPVTGEIEVVEAGRTIFLNNGEVDNSLVIAEGGMYIIAEDLINTYIAMISVEPSSNKVEVNCNNPVSRGLTAAQDFTNNITDLDYTQKKYVDQKVADSRPYKVYTALLTQSGTDAPVATVLENTLGDTITWSYVAVGQYIGTSTGTFTVNKTVIFSGSANDTDVATAMYIMALLGNENTVQIGTFNQLAVPTASDGKLTNTLIEIRVYN